jgi:hypothetical protein
LLLICTEERQPDLIHDVPSDFRLPARGDSMLKVRKHLLAEYLDLNVCIELGRHPIQAVALHHKRMRTAA